MGSLCKFHSSCLRIFIIQNSGLLLRGTYYSRILCGTFISNIVNPVSNMKNLLPIRRQISISSVLSDKSPRDHVAVRQELFDCGEEKNKKDFLMAMQVFKEDHIRRGHIEFIYTALKHMEEFGVEQDMECYKSIMEVFPKGKMVAQSMIQVGFYHFPRHQQCAIDILDKMEENGLCPDLEMREIIINTFGSLSHVFRKFARMLYWMPKFKNMSPFPLPQFMPKQAIEIAKLALERMTSVDLQSVVTVFQAGELEDSVDDTWIVSGQSPTQERLISEHSLEVAVYVEGPFYIWLRTDCISYFSLRAEPKVQKPPSPDYDLDDVSNLESEILNPALSPVGVASVHEQEDGVILGLCATGSSSRDSLLSWVRFLQRSNPRLKDIPILFTLKSPVKELVTVNQHKQGLLA